MNNCVFKINTKKTAILKLPMDPCNVTNIKIKKNT
jgi:hypothetical protein